MPFQPDAELEASIERHKGHLPDGQDLTLLVLKGHLLVEAGLDDLIQAACPEPQQILGGRPLAFRLKMRIARALTGHVVYPGLWPMIDALNTLRNDLAHRLESPVLTKKIVEFMNMRQTHIGLLSDAGPVSESNWLLDRMRSDISLLIAQLYGRAFTVRAAVKAVEPWKAIVNEINRQQEAPQAGRL
jgi:hypothetical protein